MTQKPNIQEANHSQVRSLRTFLENPTVKDQIGKALPKFLSPERMIRQAMTLCQTTPALLNCTQISILTGIMKAAELGLELAGPLGQSYLVPRKNKGLMEANFQIGYRGLVCLAFRSGLVSSFPVRTVYANDKFRIFYGSVNTIEHEPCLKGPRGEQVGYYAVCFYKGGGLDFEYMTREEVAEHRDKYAASRHDAAPWQTHFEAMSLKTVCRKLGKRTPLSPEFVAAAVEDEYFEGAALVADDLPQLSAPRSELILNQLEGEPDVGEPEDSSVSEPK